jgi:hypothetical protein
MRDYTTIKRDHVHDYMSDYTHDYMRLYAIMLFIIAIIRDYVDEECLRYIDWKPEAHRQNRKLPDGAFMYDLSNNYTHYVYYYTHYMSLLNRIAAPVWTFYALRFYAHAFWVEQRA